MEQQKPDSKDDLWSNACAIKFGEIHQMIHSKYHIDAHDWIETLTEEDLNRIPNF